MELENIEKQLLEIEILKSIYSNSNEFRVEDEEALVDAQVFLTNPNDKSLLKRKLGFTIKFNADVEDKNGKYPNNQFFQLNLEILCRLPTMYPGSSHPDVFIRCLNNNLARNFPEELTKYVISSHNNDCSILNIIEWVKENINRFINSSESNNSSSIEKSNSLNKNIISKEKIKFERMFIYSHHIYSVDKRKLIVQWTKDLYLNGFFMPGKPGIICVEGKRENVQEYWSRLKTQSWQRLQIKETQTFEIEPEYLVNVKKFDNFEEKLFTVNNNDNFDLGLLFAFLKEKNLDYIFNLYFGVDGKLPSNS